MQSQFAGADVSINLIRAELISRANSGDKNASEMLKSVARRSEADAVGLVRHYLKRAGSESLETALAGLGLLAFGLVFGIIGLTVYGAVLADFETLLLLLSSFLVGQFALVKYSKMSVARLYAQEIQKMANILKVSNLVRAQYAEATRRQTSAQNLHLAYGCVS